MAGITKAYLELLGVTRGFHRYDHHTRANMAASHRLGYRQRQQTGEFYWACEYTPGVAYSTRGAAIAAAERALGLDAEYAR